MALEPKPSSSRREAAGPSAAPADAVGSRTLAFRAHDAARRSGPGGRVPAGSAERARAARVLRHDAHMALRACVPYLLLGLVAFTLLAPVSTAALPDQSLFNASYTHSQLKFRFYLEDAAPLVWVAAVLFGAAVAFGLFRFVVVPGESTARFSLSLSRGRLFAVRAGCGVAVIVLALGAPLAASLALNVWALGPWAGLYEHWAFVACGLLLAACASFALMAAALALSGTAPEALLAYAALVGCVSAVMCAADQLACALLLGNPFGEALNGTATPVAPSLFQLTAAANPLVCFLGPCSDAQSFSVLHPVYEPAACDWPLAAAWAFAVVALLACAGALFARRRAEVAGLANANRALTAFIAVVGALAAFAAVLAVLSAFSEVAGIVGAVAAFAAVCAALSAGPLARGSRNTRTCALTTGAATACVALASAVVATGAFGFSSAVPDEADVASVRVSYVGAPDLLPAKMDSASAGSGGYYCSACVRCSEPEAVRVALAAHRALADAGRLDMRATQADFGQTAVPYDLVFEYELADGSTMLRYYDRASYDAIARLLDLDAADEMRRRQQALVSGDADSLPDAERGAVQQSLAAQAFRAGRVYACDCLYADPRELALSDGERAELLGALAADVGAQGVADRYYPQGPARGVLMFTQNAEADAQSFAYRLENAVVYLTDAFSNTLAWLQEKGLMGCFDADSTAIEELTFQAYDPHASNAASLDLLGIVFKGYRDDSPSSFVMTQEWGLLYSTDERADIDELAPKLRNTCAVDGGGYLVRAKLGGGRGYSYLFLPADDASEQLKELIG